MAAKLRHGWNFFPCGCSFVVNLKWRMVCCFDGPNTDKCSELQRLQDERMQLVMQNPTDWDAVYLNSRRKAEHLDFPQDLIERGYPPKSPVFN